MRLHVANEPEVDALSRSMGVTTTMQKRRELHPSFP